MVGLAATAEQFFSYFGICASVTFAAYGFGYFVSAASPRMEISVLIAPLTLVLWLTLAGKSATDFLSTVAFLIRFFFCLSGVP